MFSSSRAAVRPAVALALLLAGATALAADPVGPEIGSNNRYTTAIRTAGGLPDSDDYVGALIEGERLSVTVTSGKGSLLQPRVVLVNPDGAPASPSVGSRSGGKSVFFKNFVIDRTGPWTVRVLGENASQGEYTVAFAVKKAKTVKLKKLTLGGVDPLSRVHTFGGVDGALLTLTVKKGKGAAVNLDSVLDPTGNAVPGTPGAGKATLNKVPLSTGAGDYSLQVSTPGPAAAYGLTIKVVPTDRKIGKKPEVLSADEPVLDAVSSPVRVAPGAIVRLRGSRLPTPATAVVLFGDTPATVQQVGVGGGFLDVVAPDRGDGVTLPVTVFGPDRQSTTRVSYVFYAPPPVLTSVRDTTGAARIGGTNQGGLVLELSGSGFANPDTVRFGAVSVSPTTVLGTTAIRVSTPQTAPAVVQLRVEDEFGRSSTSVPFELKQPPSFAPSPLDPVGGVPGAQTQVTVTGSGFEDTDVLTFGGAPVASTFVNGASLQFTTPGGGEGRFRVAVRDRVGTEVQGPEFVVKAPPVIVDVSVAFGDEAGSGEIPLAGGTVLRVVGTGFDSADTIVFGGNAVTAASRTGATSFDFAAPAHGAGFVDLTVTDLLGRTDTFTDAARHVGFADRTSTSTPGAGTVDDLSVFQAALGDLDGDGAQDDMVIASYDYYYGNVYSYLVYANGVYVGARVSYSYIYGPGGYGVYNQPGTRNEYTRLLFGNAQGSFTDVTSTKFPQATTTDNWNGTAVALGDIDGVNGTDIVLGGIKSLTAYLTESDVRLLLNDGTGGFTYSAANSPGSRYIAPIYAYLLDATGTIQYAYYYTVFSPRYAFGIPTSIAVGDLDGDDDPDVVVGRNSHDRAYVGLNPTNTGYVDFTTYAVPVIYYAYVYNPANYPNLYTGALLYYSGTLVLDNDFENGNGLVDVTGSGTGGRLPDVGGSTSNPVPAFHARGVALGDLDGDDDLDLVVTWDDPTTVSAYGLYYGTGYDTPRVATRVLLNNGSGTFTDATTTWMPAGQSPEFFQANAVALEDLDGDGDPDMVLVHRDGLDAFLGTPTHGRHALRVLRNDRPSSNRFVDVTLTSLPLLPVGTSDDDFRGHVLTIRDVDGDGRKDILVGTFETLVDNNSQVIPSTRLFLGAAGLTFKPGTAFLAGPGTDSGEADVLLVGDLAGSDDPALILGVELVPAASPGGEFLRVQRWQR